MTISGEHHSSLDEEMEKRGTPLSCENKLECGDSATVPQSVLFFVFLSQSIVHSATCFATGSKEVVGTRFEGLGK